MIAVFCAPLPKLPRFFSNTDEEEWIPSESTPPSKYGKYKLRHLSTQFLGCIITIWYTFQNRDLKFYSAINCKTSGKVTQIRIYHERSGWINLFC